MDGKVELWGRSTNVDLGDEREEVRKSVVSTVSENGFYFLQRWESKKNTSLVRWHPCLDPCVCVCVHVRASSSGPTACLCCSLDSSGLA